MTCINGRSCTKHKAKDYLNPKQQERVEKLLAMLKNHKCTHDCDCIGIAQELSELGYEFDNTVIASEPY